MRAVKKNYGDVWRAEFTLISKKYFSRFPKNLPTLTIC